MLFVTKVRLHPSCHCYSGPTFSDGTLPITPLYGDHGHRLVVKWCRQIYHLHQIHKHIINVLMHEEFDHVLHHPAEVMRIGNG